jgi:hypothetical protein
VKDLASDTVGEGLHDELDILALVGGSEQIEVNHVFDDFGDGADSFRISPAKKGRHFRLGQAREIKK